MSATYTQLIVAPRGTFVDNEAAANLPATSRSGI